MKKLLSLTILLTLSLLVTSCGKDEETLLNSVSDQIQSGQFIDNAPNLLPTRICSLSNQEDGTYLVCEDGYTRKLTDEVIPLDDDEITCAWTEAEGIIIITCSDGSSFQFEQSDGSEEGDDDDDMNDDGSGSGSGSDDGSGSGSGSDDGSGSGSGSDDGSGSGSGSDDGSGSGSGSDDGSGSGSGSDDGSGSGSGSDDNDNDDDDSQDNDDDDEVAESGDNDDDDPIIIGTVCKVVHSDLTIEISCNGEEFVIEKNPDLKTRFHIKKRACKKGHKFKRIKKFRNGARLFLKKTRRKAIYKLIMKKKRRCFRGISRCEKLRKKCVRINGTESRKECREIKARCKSNVRACHKKTRMLAKEVACHRLGHCTERKQCRKEVRSELIQCRKQVFSEVRDLIGDVD